MMPASEPWSERIPLWQRCLFGLAAIGLSSLLLTARWLEPNPDGLGTHRGLGLPPCTVLAIWGVRCPACGMTTSWAHFVRGQWPSAWRANWGGSLLAAVSVAAVPWFALAAVRGRWVLWRPTERGILIVTLVIALVVLIDWCRRLTI